MKKLLMLSLAFCLFLISCKKDTIETIDTPVLTDPKDVTLSSGTFVSGAHPTSGTIKLIEDKDKNKFLVFDAFKTDAGPDLRIYLSEDKSASVFTEITKDVKNGTYQLAVPANADTGKQKFVLIWCKQFSVLFGSAELK
jgi:Electron transfer DM13